MEDKFTKEKSLQSNKELEVLNKQVQEHQKKYIIGPNGNPMLDSFGIPIIKKQTINFKTSDKLKQGWLYITENDGYYFQDQDGNLTKIKYIFMDKNDNMYFEDKNGDYYLEEKTNDNKNIINLKSQNKEPPKYATYFTYDENGNYIELDESHQRYNTEEDGKIIDFNSINNKKRR